MIFSYFEIAVLLNHPKWTNVNLNKKEKKEWNLRYLMSSCVMKLRLKLFCFTFYKYEEQYCCWIVSFSFSFQIKHHICTIHLCRSITFFIFQFKCNLVLQVVSLEDDKLKIYENESPLLTKYFIDK